MALAICPSGSCICHMSMCTEWIHLALVDVSGPPNELGPCYLHHNVLCSTLVHLSRLGPASKIAKIARPNLAPLSAPSLPPSQKYLEIKAAEMEILMPPIETTGKLLAHPSAYFEMIRDSTWLSFNEYTPTVLQEITAINSLKANAFDKSS